MKDMRLKVDWPEMSFVHGTKEVFTSNLHWSLAARYNAVKRLGKVLSPAEYQAFLKGNALMHLMWYEGCGGGEEELYAAEDYVNILEELKASEDQENIGEECIYNAEKIKEKINKLRRELLNFQTCRHLFKD